MSDAEEQLTLRSANNLTSVSVRHIAAPEILNSPGNSSWCKFVNVVPALLVDTAVFFLRAFVKKMLPPGSDVVFETRVLVSRRLQDKNESLGLDRGS